METNCLTPNRLADGGFRFSVPAYQRLFVWKDEQIKKLLSDMKEHFAEADEPYYVGILSCVPEPEKNKYLLIDGQQRITTLMLLGVVMKEYFPEWGNIIKNGELIDYEARQEYQKYFQAKANKNDEMVECAEIEDSISNIKKFINEFSSDEERKEYAKNVYNRLTFFVAELPKNYQNVMLQNNYFVAMNSQGKQLEQHEILKVQLLENEPKKEELTKIWNNICELDFSEEEEDKDCEGIKIYQPIDFEKERKDKFEKEREDKRNDKKDLPELKRSIVSFPEFLLIVLCLTLRKNAKDESFNVAYLLKQFNNAKRNGLDVPLFFENLERYRNLFDKYIIRYETTDNEWLTYSLGLQKDDDESSEKKDSLLQYQSMLYVGSSRRCKWICNFLQEIGKTTDMSRSNLLAILKNVDRELHNDLPKPEDMRYGEINRYWFWKLDYILWENRNTYFAENEAIKKAVEGFGFHKNISIEHLHPQNQSNNEIWDEADIHAFGNLAMISQSSNSEQSNKSIEDKLASIEKQISKGKIESLKLLKMYQDAKANQRCWTPEIAQKHAEEMYELLSQAT